MNQAVLQTVDRTLELLLLMSTETREWGVNELAHRLGIGPPSVHRMLQTLANRRFVDQNPVSQKYGLGTAVLRLSSAVVYKADLRKAVLPFVEVLHREVKELVHLNVREGDERVCIAAFTTPQQVNVASPVGQRNLLNGGCSSKVLLAFEPDDWIEDYLSRHTFTAYTPATVTDPERLQAQIREIRQRGYCITRGERAPGVYSVCAPVFHADGRIAAAITCTAPDSGRSEDRLPDLVAAVKAKAAEISRHLGYDRTT